MSHADAAMPRPAELQGLVDNAITNRLYGWAWNAAAAAERVTVELRLGDEVVATAVAERERADLAKAGVGDGRHAFELPLKPEWVVRRSELAVFARAADGSEAALALRIRRADVDPTGDVQRVLEAAAQAHRQLREDIERLARRLPGEDASPDGLLRALATGQAMLAEQQATLTLWLTRLDEKLAALPEPTGPAPPARRGDLWQGVLYGALAMVALGAGIGTALLFRAPG